MNESEAEELVGRGLSAGRPREAFRAQLLNDSTAALAQNARGRARWRMGGLAAAAVLIGGLSFLGGRLSAPPAPARGPGAAVQPAAEPGGVSVPDDLVAWLEAARLFKQLGMEGRMARAVDRAAALLPDAAVGESARAGPVFAAAEERPSRVELPVLPRLRGSMEGAGRIFAQSLGD